MEKAKICPAKHTRPQIPDADWRCLKCGATADDSKPFIIEENDELAQDGCALLHENDEISCWKCGVSTTGKKLAAAYAKQQALVPCPTCKGIGYIVGKIEK
jgi:hypothetical protein